MKRSLVVVEVFFFFIFHLYFKREQMLFVLSWLQATIASIVKMYLFPPAPPRFEGSVSVGKTIAKCSIEFNALNALKQTDSWNQFKALFIVHLVANNLRVLF